MAQTLTARLLKLKETPILDAAILAAIMGQGEPPADVTALARALEAEAAAVAQVREYLADVPPVATQTGPVLL